LYARYASPSEISHVYNIHLDTYQGPQWYTTRYTRVPAFLVRSMRIPAAIFAFLLLASSVFFVQQYFSGRYLLITSDPAYAVTSAQEQLNVLMIFGIIAAFFFALFVYTALTSRESAKHLAYFLSRDISASKEQFRKFYDLSPVPYLLIDSQGLIERPNKASLRFFGMTEEMLRGKNLFSFLQIPDHPKKITLYQERLSRHIPVEQGEVQVTRANGVVRWALLSIEDLSTPGDSKHQGLATVVDIHDQKELERIKTEFLSLASHQLRAPLANLKWYMDFLLTRRKEALTGDVLTYLNKMYRRNEDMIDLVNTLLNLSRIEMGRVQVDTGPVDLTPVIRGVTEELESAAKEKEITIHSELPDTFPITTDGKLVRIIIQNLLSNAIRYTPTSGHVEVTLATNAGRGALVQVVDSGIGIPPEEQDRIFSKLYRATNAKAMEVNGNGIGLYMCKALAESMGGSIDFTSSAGAGTTFRLKLPG
jgi:PAS domain S-box-containing protein